MERRNIHKQFVLPNSVVTLNDVSKMIFDLEKIDDFFLQVKVRRAGSNITLPKLSPSMEDVLRENGLNLLQETDRQKLKFILMTIKTKSPIVHMSFSETPNQKFLEKLISWLRLNISDILVLQIGIQPNIGAGFTLRTNNKFFDFSLRQYLYKHKNILVNELHKGLDK